jgi:DNA polymerase-3 subunit alpha
LEPGSALLLSLSAEAQGDDIRARIQMVEPLDQAAARLQKGLRVFIRDERPLEAISKRLSLSSNGARTSAAKAEGEVSLMILLGGGTEVEVKLPGRFLVSPQVAGALKAVPGVVQVEAI